MMMGDNLRSQVMILNSREVAYDRILQRSLRANQQFNRRNFRNATHIKTINPMRAAAESQLSANPKFRSVRGTAEATTLADGSVGPVSYLVVAVLFVLLVVLIIVSVRRRRNDADTESQKNNLSRKDS